jgi:hypothetical protein
MNAYFPNQQARKYALKTIYKIEENSQKYIQEKEEEINQQSNLHSKRIYINSRKIDQPQTN